MYGRGGRFAFLFQVSVQDLSSVMFASKATKEMNAQSQSYGQTIYRVEHLNRRQKKYEYALSVDST